jgi:hypothetical protein
MNGIFLLRGIVICAFRGYQKILTITANSFYFPPKNPQSPKYKDGWLATSLIISVTLPTNGVYCYDMHE